MTGPRTRTRRLAAIALAVAALAALLPAGVSAASPGSVWAPWAGDGSGSKQAGLTACAVPAADLATCFGSFANGFEANASATIPHVGAIATDGTDVTMATEHGGGLRCPLAGLGTGCSRVMTGPWPSDSNKTNALAASGGWIWIGQNDGKIFRCPGDLPYVDQADAPSGCVLLDDAKVRPISSLILVNGVLWAGLDVGCAGFLCKESGLVWRCDPTTKDSCVNVQLYNKTSVTALAAGAGSIWAGLGNGKIVRCDPSGTSGCADWKTPGSAWIQSLSYDGAGTLYAGTADGTWSCPTGSTVGCSSVNASGSQVAAVGGVVYSSGDYVLLDGGTTIYPGTDPDRIYSYPDQKGNPLLYIPAGGLPALGAANVQVRFPEAAKRLAARCADGVPLIAHVRVTGPNDFHWKRTVDVCRIRNPRMPDVRLGLLDPGTYHVRVRTPKHEAEGSVVVTGDSTHALILQLLGRR